MIGKILFVVEPEIVDESLSVAPALFDLYPAVEIDFAHEEALHILARLCRDFLEHLALRACEPMSFNIAPFLPIIMPLWLSRSQ